MNPVDYLGHDPNEPVRYKLQEDEELASAKKRAKGGIQWDELTAELSKLGGWYMANIVWSGPVSGVLALLMVTFPILGAVKKKKVKQAIQAQFEERKKQRSNQKGVAGGKPAKPAGKGRLTTKKAPEPDSQPVGKYLYLCFTGYDEDDALTLRKGLSKYKYDLRCRKLDNGAVKMFDNEVVELVCSSRAVILVASGSAYKSERVQQEIELAKDEGKPIVPIYLDDTDLPANLGFLAEDPDYVYFDSRNAKSSLLGILAFLNNKGFPPG